jgi:abortive infection bacteriophage resistance protein
MKTATTIDEQIEILKSRGMELDGPEEKIKEELYDIGYFRLGFYCFPFEENYPSLKNRNHKYKQGVKFSNTIKLYYLDVDLRNMLMKYINRIEINFKTQVIYVISNRYKNSPTWFVNTSIVNKNYIEKFDEKVYTASFKTNKVIKMHHEKYINDKYAPAWKTLEFMTFGAVLTLFKNLKDNDLKLKIANHYGLISVTTFINYMETIVFIRNACAHCNTLFDFSLPKAIKSGPALCVNQGNKNKPYSIIKIILFILGKISKNRARDMWEEINKLFGNHKSNVEIRNIIETKVGYSY